MKDVNVSVQGVRDGSKTKKLVMIAILGGLSAVLMFFKFPIPFMPPFMEFDFAGVVELIGGFTLGPLAAFLIVLIKILVKLVLMGSTTAFTGELSNFILSCSYVIPAVIIYQHQKSKHSALWGMMVGTGVCSALAIISNMYFIIPFYSQFLGLSMEAIIGMCNGVNPYVTDSLTLVLWGILPFNLIKYGVTSVLAFWIYKKVSVKIKQYLLK